MLDFLCGWEQIQKSNTGSHIPQMQRQIILMYLYILLICYQAGWKIPSNKATPSALQP